MFRGVSAAPTARHRRLGGWDLAPVGKRVQVVAPVESADATKAEHHVVFLQNFFDELRRKVPLGK